MSKLMFPIPVALPLLSLVRWERVLPWRVRHLNSSNSFPFSGRLRNDRSLPSYCNTDLFRPRWGVTGQLAIHQPAVQISDRPSEARGPGVRETNIFAYIRFLRVVGEFSDRRWFRGREIPTPDSREPSPSHVPYSLSVPSTIGISRHPR